LELVSFGNMDNINETISGFVMAREAKWIYLPFGAVKRSGSRRVRNQDRLPD